MILNIDTFKEMADEPHEIIGWIGMLLIVSAFASINFGLVAVENIWYQLANAVGAAALIYNTLKTGAYPVTLLNIVWLLVALVAIVNFI